MISKPFRFFVSGEHEPVFPGSRLWQYPLSGKPSGVKALNPQAFAVGDYFAACEAFLSRDRFSVLKEGVSRFSGHAYSEDDLESVHICLEKHGAFYHPLKISVMVSGEPKFHFVLNGAVSDQGLSVIQTECQLISRLGQTGKKKYLPRVFGSGEIQTGKGLVGFFLGQWFDGFKEFHITHRRNKEQVVVWDSDGSCSYLEMSQAFGIYREIAKILTCFYDIETYEQVFPWHHAAGDFIIRYEAGTLQVKLITIRGYAPFTALDTDSGDKSTNILLSLLLFFLHLTIRMRLDRLDGTGKPVMIGEDQIRAVADGFLSALDEKTPEFDYGDIRKSFQVFMGQFDAGQLCQILENILDSYQSQTSEIKLIKENLVSHCSRLQQIFKSV